jgi:opacity protein-like surface antigen
MMHWHNRKGKREKEKPMKKMISTIVIGLAVMSSVVFAAAQQQNSPQVQHRLVSDGKISNPAPPDNARYTKGQSNSIGKGRVAVTTAQPGSSWQERLAIGNSRLAVVRTNFLYDPNRGVVYGYRDDDFACKDGQTANGSVLEARYTAGNKAGKPAGSGWYAVELQAGKCGAKESGVYGCKLDSSGTATDCGMATINNQTGEIDLVAAQ